MQKGLISHPCVQRHKWRFYFFPNGRSYSSRIDFLPIWASLISVVMINKFSLCACICHSVLKCNSHNKCISHFKVDSANGNEVIFTVVIPNIYGKIASRVWRTEKEKNIAENHNNPNNGESITMKCRKTHTHREKLYYILNSVLPQLKINYIDFVLQKKNLNEFALLWTEFNEPAEWMSEWVVDVPVKCALNFSWISLLCHTSSQPTRRETKKIVVCK